MAKHTKNNEKKLFSVNNFWLLNDKLMKPRFWGLRRGKVPLHSHKLIYSWCSLKLQIIWNILTWKNRLSVSVSMWNSNVGGSPGRLFTTFNNSHLVMLCKDWGETAFRGPSHGLILLEYQPQPSNQEDSCKRN